MKNFVSYADMTALMTAIGQKFSALNGAYVVKGNTTFENLPSVLTKAMNGFVYNVTNAFETDSRFVDGAGKKYPAGTNVVVVDNSTITYDVVTPVGSEDPSAEGWYELVSGDYVLSEDTSVDAGKTYYEKVETTIVKFDVNSGFIDVDALEAAIQAVSDMIAGEFDADVAYDAQTVLVYNGKLYKLKAAHAATDAWDPTNADEVTVVDLITAAEPDSLTPEQVTALIALLD